MVPRVRCCHSFPEGPMMRQFFKGWRRRLGLAVLVIAVLIQILWFRTRVVADTFCWRIDPQTIWRMEFSERAILCESLSQEGGPPGALLPIHKTFDWTTNRYQGSIGSQWLPFVGSTIWHTADGRGRHAHGNGFEASIPYLTTIVTLAVLSAYLIRWTPVQPSGQNQGSRPILKDKG